MGLVPRVLGPALASRGSATGEGPGMSGGDL